MAHMYNTEQMVSKEHSHNAVCCSAYPTMDAPLLISFSFFQLYKKLCTSTEQNEKITKTKEKQQKHQRQNTNKEQAVANT